MISRRRLLQTVAGVGVMAAIPVVLHAQWAGRNFSRSNYNPDYLEPPTGEESWINWSGVQKATPKIIASPTTEQELAHLINSTTMQVRPVGSGHSSTGLAPTDGMMVDCSAFKGLKTYDPVTSQATFGSGTYLFEATAELDKLGRAFPNLPDIDVQTLAGAFSTGTHGTGNKLTAIHDYITGFRIVTANGEIRDVTKSSNPDLFSAGKVSLGALGIITQYTLKTVPAFNLHRRLIIEKVEPFLDRAEEIAAQHRNFECFYSPNTGYIAWLTHDVYDGALPKLEASEEDDAVEGLKELRDLFGWWPWLRRQAVQAAFPTGVMEDIKDKSNNLLATTRATKFNEMEYHLPREKGIEVLRTIVKMMDNRKDAFFPVEYRHIAPDDAWLSPFNGRASTSIAIHAAVDEPYDYFFSEFEPVFKKAGGRPHWGKLHSLSREELSSLYPDFEKFLKVRRSLDPTGKFLNPHLAKLFGENFVA
ncbi:MAG: D-arabinono-1,4-lactone oxidase [Sneathiella sp.]